MNSNKRAHGPVSNRHAIGGARDLRVQLSIGLACTKMAADLKADDAPAYHQLQTRWVGLHRYELSRKGASREPGAVQVHLNM